MHPLKLVGTILCESEPGSTPDEHLPVVMANTLQDMGFRPLRPAADTISFKGGMLHSYGRFPRARCAYLVDSGSLVLRRHDNSLAIDFTLRFTFLFLTAAPAVAMLLLAVVTAPRPELRILAILCIAVLVLSATYSAREANRQFRTALLVMIGSQPGITNAA